MYAAGCISYCGLWSETFDSCFLQQQSVPRVISSSTPQADGIVQTEWQEFSGFISHSKKELVFLEYQEHSSVTG